jgi:hypothetical protein
LGGGNNESRQSKLNSTNNPARGAVIEGKPPAGSTAAFWVDNDADMFSVHAPVGSIVEVHVSTMTARPGNPGFAPTVTVAGLTVGDVYYAAMNNSLLTIDDGN